MDRRQLIVIAENTLDILEKGSYVNDKGAQVNIMTALTKAVEDSVLFTPDESILLLTSARQTVDLDSAYTPQFEVTKETTLECIGRLVGEGESHIACLNFASARTPGGGFRKGASAQEESIARSSGLFPCISQMRDMYDYNRELLHGFYSDHLIYSPDVPVFKGDDGKVLDQPIYATFLTAPAVNAGVVRDKAWEDSHLILDVLKRRIELVLALAILYRHEVIILGAFGCGVFRNDPTDVARLFQEVLQQSPYRTAFRRIVFAVYEPLGDEVNYSPFSIAFGSEHHA